MSRWNSWDKLENQVFLSKPLGRRLMLVEEVKKDGDKILYSATTICYDDMTVKRTVDEEVNELWLNEWWEIMRKENTWEEEVDHFAECLKKKGLECQKKHKDNVDKDKAFFQSTIGNTYKIAGEPPVYILVRSFSQDQQYTHQRKYSLDIAYVNSETGEIEDTWILVSHRTFGTIYKPCEYGDFNKAIEDIYKSKIAKYHKIREKSLLKN